MAQDEIVLTKMNMELAPLRSDPKDYGTSDCKSIERMVSIT